VCSRAAARPTRARAAGAQIKARSRPGASLADHFFAKFGRGTPACQAAQRTFAESMAAYSLVCYLLQIKARRPPRAAASIHKTVHKPRLF
jgi:hypothetical protein